MARSWVSWDAAVRLSEGEDHTCIATSDKGITTSYKELLVAMHLLLVAMHLL